MRAFARHGGSLMKTAVRLAALTIVLLVGIAPGVASADAGDPQVFIESPADGGLFPQGVNVQFGFYCTSDASFVISCVGSQPLGSLIDTTNAGTHTLSVTATDYDGRTTTATATYTVFDTTPPHVDFRMPADGATYAQGASMTYDYDCADDPGGLGIQECFAGNRMPPGAPLDTHKLGTFTFDVYALDWQNNLSHQSVTYTIVDRTPPATTIAAPADGATYTRGQQVWVSFSCDDGLYGSGVQSCKGSLPSGTLLDTSTLGSHTLSVTAYDRAGNESDATSTYSVIYDFGGFVSPSAPYPTATSMKAGQSVPVKFSLNGDQGSAIFADGAPAWASCGSSDTSPAAGTLSYNASNDRYTFLAATAKSWAGTCRDLVVTLADGTVHKLRFTFTK
jgi:hypothetical protein